VKERPADLHPSSAAPEKTSNSLAQSRRSFIGTAAWATGAITVSPLFGSRETTAEAETPFGRGRAVEAFRIRQKAALEELNSLPAVHRNNGDEQLYSNKIGNYSKALPHNSLGEVELAAYNGYLNALR
jgi:hypothetical protein